LNDAIGEERSSRVDVNSIDGFQGREKEVCVFSVCRAPREDRGAKKKKVRSPYTGPHTTPSAW
jgi:senataxin